MAGIARPIGIAAQIRLIAALRWRMTWNGLRRQSNRMDMIGMVVGGVFAVLAVCGTSVGFAFGAYAILEKGRAQWIGLLYWAIFVFWQVFPIFAAGFGQKFDFRSLLRFPLSLRTFYAVSLAYGLADFAAAAAFCWLVAMTIGASAARPDVVPAMIVVSGLFLVGNVALERLLGSWLDRLLAKRRTRELIFALFILLSISANLVGQVIQKWGTTGAPWVVRILPYLSVFPPGLAGRGIAAATAHQAGGILLNCAGAAGYVVLFGALLWLRLATQYRGEELSETQAPSAAQRPPRAVKTAVAEEDSRWLSPQVAAVLKKEFRYLRRNTFALINLLTPLLLVVILSSQLGMASRRHAGTKPFGISADWAFPGMLAYLLLILAAPAYNCFAYEGRGIQTYYTSPVRFRDVLAGKNLMVLLVMAAEISLCIWVLALRAGIPPLPRFIATLAAIVFSVSGQLIVANWSSLTFPRKLEFGSMRNQRASGMAVLMLFAVQIVLAGASSMIFLAGRWFESPWLPAGVFSLLAAATIAGYFASLDSLSGLAERKREVLIEALCR
jgi:ABC-2 type transport system permease protein